VAGVVPQSGSGEFKIVGLEFLLPFPSWEGKKKSKPNTAGLSWKQSSCLGGVDWLAAPHLGQPGMGRDLTTAAQAGERLVPSSSSYLVI
jgi:hypothetical protein